MLIIRGLGLLEPLPTEGVTKDTPLFRRRWG